MERNVFQRSIVVGIIVLFVGAGVLPSTIGTIYYKTFTTKISSRGYIQGLIDNASAGDTIFVPSGTYYENIIINKSISLVGEDKNNTIIDGLYYSGDVVTISADRVNISRFTICHGNDSGIIVNSNYNTIADNNISYNGDPLWFTINTGINLNGSNNLITRNILFCNGWGWFSTNSIRILGSNNTISKNYILWNGAGIMVYSPAKFNFFTDNIILRNEEYSIYLWGSTNNVITGNNITNNSYGRICVFNCNIVGNIISKNKITNNGESISLRNSSHIIITDNIISDNGEGIGLSFCHNNSIINNSISNTQYYGISLQDATNNFIANNTVSNTNVYIESSNENTIINNSIINNPWLGINIFDSNNNSIIGNNISNNENGIRLFNSSNNDITTNIISNNHAIGIQVRTNAKDNRITFNDITLNLEQGIFLLDANNNIVFCNNISENENGIELQNTKNTTITNNIISSNNGSGIEFHGSSINLCNNNTIKYNTIKQNNQSIYLENASNNIILDNNLLRNKRHVLFENCTNTWSKNYWNRPRILPKLIFGTIFIRNMTIPWFNIDWRPALKPYDIPRVAI